MLLLNWFDFDIDIENPSYLSTGLYYNSYNCILTTKNQTSIHQLYFNKSEGKTHQTSHYPLLPFCTSVTLLSQFHQTEQFFLGENWRNHSLMRACLKAYRTQSIKPLSAWQGTIKFIISNIIQWDHCSSPLTGLPPPTWIPHQCILHSVI